jgi:hypothetical protein
MKNTIYVGSLEQQALMELELKEQVSDGHWENDTPMNHWEALAEAEVVIRPEKVGRNFKVRKKYNFADEELVSIVGRRMITFVQLARYFGVKRADVIGHYLFTLGGTFAEQGDRHIWLRRDDGSYVYGGGYYNEIRQVLRGVNHPEIYLALSVPYTEEELQADLKALTAAYQVFLRE